MGLLSKCPWKLPDKACAGGLPLLLPSIFMTFQLPEHFNETETEAATCFRRASRRVHANNGTMGSSNKSDITEEPNGSAAELEAF